MSAITTKDARYMVEHHTATGAWPLSDLNHAVCSLADTVDAQAATIAALREKLSDCLPIVSEAWYDNASAGWMPGSGYNHRVYGLVSAKWGWRKADAFEAWLKEAKALAGIQTDERGRG